MTFSRSCLVAILCLASAFTTLQACGDEEPSNTGDDASTTSSSGGSSGGSSSGTVNSSSSGDVGTSSSSGANASSSGTNTSSSGGLACAAFVPFGAEAVQFTQDDNAGARPPSNITEIPSGSYDLIYAARSSSTGGSARETIVLHDAVNGVRAFERIRQWNGGKLREWVGTFTASNGDMRFDSTCSRTDGVDDAEADDNNILFSILTPDGGGATEIHYGAAALGFVLRKRN